VSGAAFGVSGAGRFCRGWGERLHQVRGESGQREGPAAIDSLHPPTVREALARVYGLLAHAEEMDTKRRHEVSDPVEQAIGKHRLNYLNFATRDLSLLVASLPLDAERGPTPIPDGIRPARDWDDVLDALAEELEDRLDEADAAAQAEREGWRSEAEVPGLNELKVLPRYERELTRLLEGAVTALREAVGRRRLAAVGSVAAGMSGGRAA
jgi:hypothetical protein